MNISIDEKINKIYKNKEELYHIINIANKKYLELEYNIKYINIPESSKNIHYRDMAYYRIIIDYGKLLFKNNFNITFEEYAHEKQSELINIMDDEVRNDIKNNYWY